MENITVYHGTTSWKIHNLLNGVSSNWYGLCVTDTAARAQLYADARATEVVSTKVRHAENSAVVELETTETVKWLRRPASHNTLDKCESTIKSWTIKTITLYMTKYAIEHSIMQIQKNSEYVNIVNYLKAALQDKLTIVIID